MKILGDSWEILRDSWEILLRIPMGFSLEILELTLGDSRGFSGILEDS